VLREGLEIPEQLGRRLAGCVAADNANWGEETDLDCE
jgi:hypothetical protein